MTAAKEEQLPAVQRPAAVRSAAPRPALDWLFGAGIIAVSAAISASVIASETDGSFAALNCVRFGTAASAACLHFSAFLLVAILFQPDTDKGAAGARHRSMFSKLARARLCGIAAACMGYPRDLCGKVL